MEGVQGGNDLVCAVSVELAILSSQLDGPFVGLGDNVRWSTENALADTLKNLRGNQTYVLLESLDDIDEAEAYKRWKKKA